MDENRSGNGQQLILSEELYLKISKLVEKLTISTGAEYIIFCESNGYPVTHSGDIKEMDLPTISSLAAGNFSATAKMASMLGENGRFKYLFHEGENQNLYISNVGFNFLLVVVFKVEVALGMVRIYTKKAIESLNDMLESAKQEEEESKEFLDMEFKTLLSEELNRSLKL